MARILLLLLPLLMFGSVASAQPVCWDTDSGLACLSVTPYPDTPEAPTVVVAQPTSTFQPTTTTQPTSTPVPTTAPATPATKLTPIPIKATSTTTTGTTRVVGTGGYATISAALTAAVNGDTIKVHAGTYSETATINQNAITLTAFGDGQVWINGACTRAHGVTVHGNDVVVRGIGVKSITDSGIWIDGDNGYKPYRANIDQNTIQDYNCAGTGEQYAAGVACLYCGSNQRVTSNTITRRVAGPPAGQGNGIWFKSSSAKPSGGGHYIANNVIVGGWDGIGGEDEGDPHGSFDRTFVIENNAISYCADDGIQVEGGGQYGRVVKNRINECGLGIAFANVYLGPLYIESNVLASSTMGALGNLACFKTGNDSPATVYLTANTCDTPGDGLQQTNSGTGTVIATDNVFNVGRYVYEWTYNAPLGTFDRDCMVATDPTRFIKWNNTVYTSLAAFTAATGQEANGRVGPC